MDGWKVTETEVGGPEIRIPNSGTAPSPASGFLVWEDGTVSITRFMKPEFGKI